MSVIYRPKGAAGEYARAGLNLYKGCTHGCTYCYAPGMQRKSKAQYFSDPAPKEYIVSRVLHDAQAWARMDCPPEIMLSFIGDCYQPIEEKLCLTRQVLKILIHLKLPLAILTKGGHLARRDFDLLSKYEACRFGTSFSYFAEKDAARVEPGAATVAERIDTLAHAKRLGIKTWVSLEPVISRDQALLLIDLLHELVDFWAVGKINHDRELEARVDWPAFHRDVVEKLNDYGALYYIKNSLACAAQAA